MDYYKKILDELNQKPKTWLISGVAGFIGSHLLEKLLTNNQRVVGIDNFATGHTSNLDEVRSLLTNAQWKNFKFIKGDITCPEICLEASIDIDYVLHQAALGSVPRSVKDPNNTNNVNVTGFLNMLVAAKQNQVSSFTYASSSSVYGDHPSLPKVENNIGSQLSPYAVSKYTNELYASVFAKCYGFNSIGLRYFNVFGKRQDPNGVYAAVIPRWVNALKENRDIIIYGDGETSRDFCFIDNVVQANILSAVSGPDAKNHIYNIAVGEQTSLNELFKLLLNAFRSGKNEPSSIPIYQDFRDGDIRHSIANIEKAKKNLKYYPQTNINQGIELLINHDLF